MTATPAGAKANCRFCGEAWFGDVAYCPYCGRPSASAGVPAASDAAPDAISAPSDGSTQALASEVRSDADQMRSYAGTGRPGWTRWAAPVGLAIALAAFVFALAELAGTAADRPGRETAGRAPPGDTARSGTPESSAGVAASAPAVPRAQAEHPAQAGAPAQPARNRSLCSAASEAAGLCNPR